MYKYTFFFPFCLVYLLSLVTVLFRFVKKQILNLILELVELIKVRAN